MSWRYAPWSTRLVRFQKPDRPLRKKVMAPAAGPKLLKWVATGRSAKRSWLRRRGKAAKAGGSPGGRAKLLKSRQLLMST